MEKNEKCLELPDLLVVLSLPKDMIGTFNKNSDTPPSPTTMIYFRVNRTYPPESVLPIFSHSLKFYIGSYVTKRQKGCTLKQAFLYPSFNPHYILGLNFTFLPEGDVLGF
jgi:hypothetical protein